jgi:hypothetical protein
MTRFSASITQVLTVLALTTAWAFPLDIARAQAASPSVCRDWNVDKHVRLMADVNNDQKGDIVAFGDAGVWTALSKGDGTFDPQKLVLADFGANQGWSPDKHVRLMADVNNDGKSDIVAFGDAGVWTALSKGDGTFDPQKLVLADFGMQQGWDPAKHVRVIANVSNDQKGDIVAFGDAGVWTALGNADGAFDGQHFVLADFGAQQGWSPARHVRLMADISNDGIADIVAFGDAGVWTALGKGNGAFGAPALVLGLSGILCARPVSLLTFEPLAEAGFRIRVNTVAFRGCLRGCLDSIRLIFCGV